MFSNCYTLIRSSNTDKIGKFTKTVYTDDLQMWYGQGSFKEDKRRITLTYAPVDTLRVERFLNATLDSTSIRWVDISRSQMYFTIRIVKGAGAFQQFEADNGIVKISNAELTSDSLMLYDFNDLIGTFKFLPGDSLIIHAINKNKVHLLDTNKTILRKRKNNLIGPAMWTTKKTSLFTRR